MAEIRHKQKCRNHISALVAIYKTGEALENFTKQGLSSVHNHIKQTVGNLPPCLNQCSQKEKETNSWCYTCKAWRIELEIFFPPKIRHRHNWKGTKSWCWPNSELDIADVFVKPEWRNNIALKDISTTFIVWDRCLQFQRQLVNLLKPLKESRNELVHHPDKMKLTNKKKTRVFQQIGDVINHHDIQITVPNHADFLQTLNELQRDKLFANDVERVLEDIGTQNANIKANLDALSLTVEHYNVTFSLLMETIEKVQRNCFKVFVLCAIVLIVSVLCSISQWYIYQGIYLGLTSPVQSPRNIKDDKSVSSEEGCPETIHEQAALVALNYQHWYHGMMYIAVHNGHKDIITYLLKNNKLFDYPVSKYESMNALPIHEASKKGLTGIIELLHSSYKQMLDWQCFYDVSEIGNQLLSCIILIITGLTGLTVTVVNRILAE